MIALGLAGALVAMMATAANGHSGGLNAEGCHTNRKTGEHHCHRPQAAKPAEKPRERARLHDAPAQAERPVSFGSCAEARANGYRRMKAGQPGYARRLDRDGDGVACE